MSSSGNGKKSDGEIWAAGAFNTAFGFINTVLATPPTSQSEAD